VESERWRPMNVETMSHCDVSSRPTRAGIAQMTLQLRALLRDATAEEERAGTVDVDAAREKLRARLGPVVDERRRDLDESLAAARADAAAAIAAARVAASSLIVEATDSIVEVPAVEAGAVDSPTIDAPCLPVRQLPLSSPVVEPDQPAMFNIVVDSEAFAQAFAAAFAELFDGHLASMANSVPTWLAHPAPPEPKSTKQSFWTHARHPDVLLMGLSMVIVLVVLAAWFA
jgi:hypothetical protein